MQAAFNACPSRRAKEIMSHTQNPIAPSALAPLAPAEVALTQVSKSFGKGTDRVDVLNQINLVAAPGEILAILGPSGCGKSTLLRLVLHHSARHC